MRLLLFSFKHQELFLSFKSNIIQKPTNYKSPNRSSSSIFEKKFRQKSQINNVNQDLPFDLEFVKESIARVRDSDIFVKRCF